MMRKMGFWGFACMHVIEYKLKEDLTKIGGETK
jgi:hypothetical protein